MKGTHFLSLRDAGDPVELAQRYNEQGADEVVFLDITASKEKRGTIVELIKRAADQLFLPLTVGGGIRSLDDIQQILRAGADKVSINTSAVHEPGLITKGAESFGTQCIVVAMDVRRNYTPDPSKTPVTLENGKTCWYEVVIYGGSKPTGIDAIRWAREAEERGAGEILLTSMETDGTKNGFDLAVTAAISEAANIPVIAIAATAMTASMIRYSVIETPLRLLKRVFIFFIIPFLPCRFANPCLYFYCKSPRMQYFFGDLT